MKNFSVKIDDKEYWISRSVAVVAFLFTIDVDGDLCILANKRGSGTPDFQGFWNCPCGYLDYDETILEAIYREVSEETGIACPKFLKFAGIDSDPKSNRQNVTVRYYGVVENPISIERIGGEENEVADIKWIKINNINNYKWAFNHNELILKIIHEDSALCEIYYKK